MSTNLHSIFYSWFLFERLTFETYCHWSSDCCVFQPKCACSFFQSFSSWFIQGNSASRTATCRLTTKTCRNCICLSLVGCSAVAACETMKLTSNPWYHDICRDYGVCVCEGGGGSDWLAMDGKVHTLWVVCCEKDTSTFTNLLVFWSLWTTFCDDFRSRLLKRACWQKQTPNATANGRRQANNQECTRQLCFLDIRARNFGYLYFVFLCRGVKTWALVSFSSQTHGAVDEIPQLSWDKVFDIPVGWCSEKLSQLLFSDKLIPLQAQRQFQERRTHPQAAPSSCSRMPRHWFFFLMNCEHETQTSPRTKLINNSRPRQLLVDSSPLLPGENVP